jgi:preprotein translocase subunit SecA
MLQKILTKIIGSRNSRIIKSYKKIVSQVNYLEKDYKLLSDDELKQISSELRVLIQKDGPDAHLVKAFALVREASFRVMGMRHFDVQLIGAIALHNGKVSEMRTGEGKTLVATLSAYLNAQTGNGVHVVTVNDYLAKRDANWMRPLYEFLGLSVGIVTSDISNHERKEAYKCDITYATNNELGFDYLRDNMVFSVENKAQKKLNYCIIDEVDSILIDEARTPLIISGRPSDSSNLYKTIYKIVSRLKNETSSNPDYDVDLKTQQVFLTEEGNKNIESLLKNNGFIKNEKSLFAPENVFLLHYINACLKAKALFHKDSEYVIENGKIVIVDEHTGRTVSGRRWSDGIHQAVEAKENVEIQKENQTLASITFQNYFKMYNKISGMTGTAETEALELTEIYNLEVIIIPTNKKIQRIDESDLVYLDINSKNEAILEDIKSSHAKNQPVMIGTASIESSEHLSKLLSKKGLKHKVLNAKYHEQEAEIVAKAGEPGAITIATNMAGRGTDIKLGGNLEHRVNRLNNDPSEEQIELIKREIKRDTEIVLQSGGLRIIGSERHESRRIDNQLRGRAGRQGDPGSTRFYLSFDDKLMRVFASDKTKAMMIRFGLKPGEAIEHRIVNNVIANSQKKLEGVNFDIRKQLLDYDNITNEQRKIIYKQRNEILDSHKIDELELDFLEDVAITVLDKYAPENQHASSWKLDELEKCLSYDFKLNLNVKEIVKNGGDDEKLQLEIESNITKLVNEKFSFVEKENVNKIKQEILLKIFDKNWQEHLYAMDQLRSGIHLRSYAQKDPKQEYKSESFKLFEHLLETIKLEYIISISNIVINVEPKKEESLNELQNRNVRLGRNEPCYCGSQKKYKHCHGKIQ